MPRIRRPWRCLLLLVPLLVLQVFDASAFFCSGSTHATLLSSFCPHHVDPEEEHAGDSNTHHDGPRDSSDDPCRCPGSDNPLPDALTNSLLGGVGLPAGPAAGMPESPLTVLAAPTPRPARMLLITRPIDRPPTPIA